jgi:hypothetical protein
VLLETSVFFLLFLMHRAGFLGSIWFLLREWKMSKIEEIFKLIPGVSNVLVTASEDNDGDVNGVLDVQGMRAYFEYKRSTAIDIISITIAFEYSLLTKEKKEKALELVNFFNKTKPGMKCCLQDMSKNKLKIAFKSEIVTKSEDYDTQAGALFASVPILSAAPLIFSMDMENKSIQHKKIVRAKDERKQ